MQSFPDELILFIFKFLEPSDLWSVAYVCQQWKRIVVDTSLHNQKLPNIRWIHKHNIKNKALMGLTTKLKFIMVGDYGVGKHSLAFRFCNREYKRDGYGSKSDDRHNEIFSRTVQVHDQLSFEICVLPLHHAPKGGSLLPYVKGGVHGIFFSL